MFTEQSKIKIKRLFKVCEAKHSNLIIRRDSNMKEEEKKDIVHNIYRINFTQNLIISLFCSCRDYRILTKTNIEGFSLGWWLFYIVFIYARSTCFYVVLMNKASNLKYIHAVELI